MCFTIFILLTGCLLSLSCENQNVFGDTPSINDESDIKTEVELMSDLEDVTWSFVFDPFTNEGFHLTNEPVILILCNFNSYGVQPHDVNEHLSVQWEKEFITGWFTVW